MIFGVKVVWGLNVEFLRATSVIVTPLIRLMVLDIKFLDTTIKYDLT